MTPQKKRKSSFEREEKKQRKQAKISLFGKDKTEILILEGEYETLCPSCFQEIGGNNDCEECMVWLYG